PGEIVDFMVSEYRKHSDVVTGAHKVSDHEFRVCWVGDPPGDCEGERLQTVSNFPPTPFQLVRGEVNGLKLALSDRRMVLISRNSQTFPRPDETSLYMREYRELKAGKDPGQSKMREKQLAREIALPPVSLDSLRAARIRHRASPQVIAGSNASLL